jgi:3-phenylpropionate/trans-cinnamate dioxygenase ferredoxin reductase subunit
MGPKLMGRVVCSEVSDFLRKKHEENGVNFLLNRTVKDIIQYQNKKRVIFTDESYADTDVVIVGVGIQPNDGLAKKIGIKCNNGIVVDSFGETSIKNIFAIGDCSNKYNNIYKKRLRLESVQNAVDQAQMLSSFILGNTKLKTTVPWFWSDQYDIKLQIAGVSSGYDSYEIKGSIDEERFSISYKKNNTLIALDAINDPKSFMAAKKIIRNNT